MSARRHRSTLHETASASAGATSVKIANRPGVSMGSSGVEDMHALHPPAYTRDTAKIARGHRGGVRVVYARGQGRTAKTSDVSADHAECRHTHAPLLLSPHRRDSGQNQEFYGL